MTNARADGGSKRGHAATIIDRKLLRRWSLPELQANADKTARGDVLVMGGSAELPGAVLLAATAALRVGAGRVRIATSRSAAAALAVAFPEARVIGMREDRRGELARAGVGALIDEVGACGSVILGPGMRAHAAVEGLLHAMRARRKACAGTLVLDAAALRVLRGRHALWPNAFAGAVATPHAGEMAGLWGCTRDEVEANAPAIALESAEALDVVMVLKGATTFIATPDGRAFRNVAGNSGLATAGSGDVLAGVIAGIAARVSDPVQAAIWGVHLHALAGVALARKHGPLGYLAREISEEIPRQLAALDR